MIAFDVRKISSKVGKEFVIEHHYSHGIHNGPMCYGLFDGERLIGVCAFATPCSENVRASVFGGEYKNFVTELHRLVLIDETPKNSESYFISRALKLLKKDKPEIHAVVSFADQTEGHVGTIYKATNAVYTGTSGKATFYRDQTGRLRHPRQNGRNITKKEAEKLGWVSEGRFGKHRYVYFLPSRTVNLRKLTDLFRLSSLPYPRGLDKPQTN